MKGARRSIGKDWDILRNLSTSSATGEANCNQHDKRVAAKILASNR